jgi:long-subunit fatty acid transport protein
MSWGKSLPLVALIVGTGAPLRAKETGAAFLRVDAGARAAGMGSAFTAVADDATAAFWNPAGLARLDRRELNATHSDWIGDVRLDHLAYAHPSGGNVFAASLVYLSQGRLDARGADRRSLGTFQAQDAAAAFSWGRRMPGGRAAGLTVRAIDQRLAGVRASGAALDVGFLTEAGPRLRIGGVVRNVGPSMKFIDQKTALPTTAALGTQLRLGGGLSAVLDVKRAVFQGKTSVALGTEYWLMDRLALRAGYLSTGDLPSSGLSGSSTTPWSMQMGVGVRIASYQMDYALTPAGPFGNTQRLSLGYVFE